MFNIVFGEESARRGESFVGGFSEQMIAVLENRNADGVVSAMQKTERYYSTFQTPQSAKNAARIVWAVLLQGEKRITNF